MLGSGRSKRGIADVPIEEAAAYYGVWVGLIDPVGEVLARDMERAGATRLHDTMELPLVPILAAMEVEGVAVDCDLLGSISAEMHTRIAEIESEVQEVADRVLVLEEGRVIAFDTPRGLGLKAGSQNFAEAERHFEFQLGRGRSALD